MIDPCALRQDFFRHTGDSELKYLSSFLERGYIIINAMERLKKKITAVLLIMVFIQKMGLGLFLHAWLHEKPIGLANDLKNPVTHLQQVRCSCIEDAMIPFAGTDSSVLISTPVTFFFNYNNPLRVLYSSSEQIYYSLRGPPQIGDML
jgi:hypothetical protein